MEKINHSTDYSDGFSSENLSELDLSVSLSFFNDRKNKAEIREKIATVKFISFFTFQGKIGNFSTD